MNEKKKKNLFLFARDNQNMGNTISSQKHKQLKAKDIKETGFETYTEVSSSHLGGSIELVTDESCGNASNLLKVEKVDRQLNLDDLSTVYIA